MQQLNRVHAFWCRIPSRPNFGDALTPWLAQRLTGQHPIFVRPEDRRHKYLMVGSIISFANSTCTVWGSGIMNRDDNISPAATLLSVRGPLTRARAIECGADCNEIYGDPALLLPRFYSPASNLRKSCGIIGHFSDRPRLESQWRESNELRLIDIQEPVETVIDNIVACETIASSSLHGLIVSHAYGIPAVWIKFRDLPSGDDSKFHDYFLSLGMTPPNPICLQYNSINAAELSRHAKLPSTPLDTRPLWEACPFKNFL